MQMKYIRYGLMVILIMSAMALLVSCGSSSGGDDSEVVVGTPPAEEEGEEEEEGIAAAAFISLATSQTTVQSDNSDDATITATVLDEHRAVMQGETVSFSADGGQISASSVVTDEDGQVQITFSAGTASGGVSQVVTITAVVAGLTTTIPIQVVGTTVVLTTDNTNITVGDTVDLTVHVEDFSSGGLPNVLVELTESSSAITLLQTAGYTNANGELVVQVTGDAAGSGTVTALAMGITATLTFTVGTTGNVFGISSPTDPWSLDTNTDLSVVVDAPGVITVTFATTLGTFTGASPAVTGQVIDQTVIGGVATADLNSLVAGVATVQVFDADNPSTKDSLTVAISAPPDEATQISLQPSTSSVAPSFGDVSNSVTLEATVKNDDDQVVGNAPVAFSIMNPTGGGESISPVVVFTGSDGVATSTFTSGTLTSGAGGVTIQAVVVGSLPLITDSVSIVIGGTPGSVIIGRSTHAASIAGDTAYSLPMSVLVADPAGNPVSGTVVSLNVWPIYYNTGYNDEEDGPTITGTYLNEDINRNLILDALEDINGDGSLTPPNAAAGALPATVETDENGVATFDLVYLKQSAVWIADEITATTVVSGTETSSTLVFILPYEPSDEPYLPHSPYGPGELTITATAGAGGTITPAGEVFVPYGDDQPFTIAVTTGSGVDDVEVDGVSEGPVTSYTFYNVEENHTISVTFLP